MKTFKYKGLTVWFLWHNFFRFQFILPYFFLSIFSYFLTKVTHFKGLSDDFHCFFDLRIIGGRGDHKLKSSGVNAKKMKNYCRFLMVMVDLTLHKNSCIGSHLCFYIFFLRYLCERSFQYVEPQVFKKLNLSSPGWCDPVDLSAGLQTKRLPVGFLVRAHDSVAGQVTNGGIREATNLYISPSLPPFPSL